MKKFYFRILFLLIMGIVLNFCPLASYSQASSSPPERIFVHTDKSLYVIGETLWFSIYVIHAQSFRPSDFSKVAYFELLDGESKPILQEKIGIYSGRGQGQVFISPEIPSGVYYLRSYTAQMKNQGPNSFFEQAISIANPNSPPQVQVSSNNESPSSQNRPPTSATELLQLELPTNSFSRREKVPFTLTQSGKNGEQETISLSVSIYQVDSTLYFPRKHITTFSSPDKDSSIPSSSYPPENFTQVLRGKIGPVPDTTPVFLSFPGKAAEIYEVSLQKTGEFSLPLSPKVASNDMVFWSPVDDLSETPIEIYSPYSQESLLMSPITFPDSSWRKLMEAYLYHAQIGNLYLPQSQIRGAPSKEVPYQLPFYGVPRYAYRLDEYTRFPKLEEVFLEYIRFGLKRKIGNKRYIFLWDEYVNAASMGNSIPFSQPALSMIDGIPVKDPEFIWDFDVLKVEQIDLVTKLFLLGDYPFFGIANFITYDHNFGGESLPNYVVRKSWQGLLPAKEFYSPEYEEANPNRGATPDFRNTLYWEPLLNMNQAQEEISFWTSDAEGMYKIEVNGLTSEGIPVYIEEYFTVTSSRTYE
ncbi:MAG: hypothetical protein AAGA10_01220 [Bacteroidota bacterium]